ncbi:unnamed protein product [Amoebophrya sp. A25]|nr:unnamed protein product [Amoebophrya sp. A25]|eukprot:GSA25T00002976001.1
MVTLSLRPSRRIFFTCWRFILWCRVSASSTTRSRLQHLHMGKNPTTTSTSTANQSEGIALVQNHKAKTALRLNRQDTSTTRRSAAQQAPPNNATASNATSVVKNSTTTLLTDPTDKFLGRYVADVYGEVKITKAGYSVEGQEVYDDDAETFPNLAEDVVPSADLWVWRCAPTGWYHADTIYRILTSHDTSKITGITGDMQRSAPDGALASAEQSRYSVEIATDKYDNKFMFLGSDKFVKLAKEIVYPVTAMLQMKSMRSAVSRSAASGSSLVAQQSSKKKTATGALRGSYVDCSSKPQYLFAMGCFWCAEESLRQHFIASDACVGETIQSGLVGPKDDSVTYDHHDPSRYTEAIRFRSSKPIRPDVLFAFWTNVDPLNGEGQFLVNGTGYRSGIYLEPVGDTATSTSGGNTEGCGNSTSSTATKQISCSSTSKESSTSQSLTQETADHSVTEVANALQVPVNNIKTFVDTLDAQENVFHPVEESQQNYFGKHPDENPRENGARWKRLEALWTPERKKLLMDALKI